MGKEEQVESAPPTDTQPETHSEADSAPPLPVNVVTGDGGWLYIDGKLVGHKSVGVTKKTDLNTPRETSNSAMEFDDKTLAAYMLNQDRAMPPDPANPTASAGRDLRREAAGDIQVGYGKGTLGGTVVPSARPSGGQYFNPESAQPPPQLTDLQMQTLQGAQLPTYGPQQTYPPQQAPTPQTWPYAPQLPQLPNTPAGPGAQIPSAPHSQGYTPPVPKVTSTIITFYGDFGTMRTPFESVVEGPGVVVLVAKGGEETIGYEPPVGNSSFGVSLDGNAYIQVHYYGTKFSFEGRTLLVLFVADEE